MKGLLPAPGSLRPLALAMLLSRVGNRLLMTVNRALLQPAVVRQPV
jgi:hypothetical protein